MGSVVVNYRIIGLNISKQRHLHNWTQDQLAERAGLSKQFVGNIECGRAIPSLKTILSLCDALEITPNDLLTYSSRHDPNAPCTLRDDHDVFEQSITAQLFGQEEQITRIREQDLPAFDIILPDPSDEE